MMEEFIRKSPKVALCRKCGGTGHILVKIGQDQPCPQCEGSGRCIVSCEMRVNIVPFKPVSVLRGDCVSERT